MAGKQEEKNHVRSISRAVQVLELLGTQGGLTATEVSRRMGLPKSSAYEILSALTQEGLLEKDSSRGSYQLGLKLFEFGVLAQSNLELRRVAEPHLKALNRELDETVHLTVLEDGEVLYVECFESTKRLRTYSVLGVRAPLHCTAVGKAILAFRGPEEIEQIIRRRGLARFTENTITDRGRLLADLQETARRGYAVDAMEHEEGVRCVGASIRNHRGEVFASISVSGPSQRITPERIPDIGRRVIEKTREISRRLGCRD